MTHRLMMTIWTCLLIAGLSAGCSLIYDGEDLRGGNASAITDAGGNSNTGGACDSHMTCVMESRSTAPICINNQCVSTCSNAAECADHPFGSFCGGTPPQCGCATDADCTAPLTCGSNNVCMRP